MLLSVVSLVALGILVVGWIGYPAVMAALARWRSGRHARATSWSPSVSVVIATRDDPSVVAARVENLEATAYPADRVEVVVAIDSRAERPIEAYANAVGSRARVVQGDPPGGKATTLNAGARAATGDIIVFADSHQVFAPDAIPALVHFLGDERFGAVTGALTMDLQSGEHTVLDWLWRYEVMIRRAEAAVHSIVAVTGAIYAIRRVLWRPLPAGLICDDLLIPLHVAMSGSRVGFAENALAHDPRRFTREQEFHRKVRTLTGMLQLCAWEPVVLVPWRNPIWGQFVCHKLLRIATPFLVIAVFLGLLALAVGMFGRALWFALAGFAGAAALATVFWPRWMRGMAQHAGWVIRLQAAPLAAWANAVQGRWDVWKKT